MIVVSNKIYSSKILDSAMSCCIKIILHPKNILDVNVL